VRIRGCLVAVWNADTRQVQTGEIRLVAAVVNVEEPRPTDPFLLEARKASELLLFDPHANALRRTKITGQIIYAYPRDYYIQDGPMGFRAVTEEPLPLHPGDLVEAVGFPRFSGQAPILQEAQARRIGHGPLPSPVPVAPPDLMNRKLDSTLVQIEAVLLSSTANREEHVLELQAGPYRFLARLNSRDGQWKAPAAGSRLRLTGVYSSAGRERGDDNLDPFDLLLNRAADIVILQQPPWWTVRRAITVAAALAGGLGIALVWITLLRRKVEERTAQLQNEIEERQRVEQHRAMEQERTRVAHDLHDELGAGLTEVGLLGDLVKNPGIPAAEKEHYLGQLTDTARTLVASLDEIVWAVNPRYDSIASLASYYILFAQRFLDLAGIICRVQISPDFPEYPLDSKDRHGLFLAFKEALNNVIQHSHAAEVRLAIEITGSELTISIADNGRGFEPIGETPGAEGFQTMRRRMQNLGGSCDFASRPGSGTTVTLRLPVGNPVS
jgi:signal transduction histidine kinase